MNNLCLLCPNNCNVDRKSTIGACRVKNDLRISKYYLHPFEEPCISGEKGSGTIFFCGCSLGCVFCQNYDLSRNKRGKDISPDQLAELFLDLEQQGAHNINLVNPTHFVPAIIEALKIYKPKIPIVYNTHAYENIETLKLINPFIDVYLPDMKYFSENVSKRYTGKKNYFDKASKTIEFMLNKEIIFENGLMKSGTIVRHLVLPQCTSDTKKIIDWFKNFKDKAYLHLMSQYTPFGDIEKFPELQRKITKREYESVLNYAIDSGIENMFYQKFHSADTKYIPNWDY